MEDKCFALPYTGAVVGVFFGLFIILLGLSIAYDFNIWRWIGPSILIILGLFIIVSIIRRRLG
jgi:ABC-type Mn2+/Zn2+ transport system permease subunit